MLMIRSLPLFIW